MSFASENAWETDKAGGSVADAILASHSWRQQETLSSHALVQQYLAHVMWPCEQMLSKCQCQSPEAFLHGLLSFEHWLEQALYSFGFITLRQLTLGRILLIGVGLFGVRSELVRVASGALGGGAVFTSGGVRQPAAGTLPEWVGCGFGKGDGGVLEHVAAATLWNGFDSHRTRISTLAPQKKTRFCGTVA